MNRRGQVLVEGALIAPLLAVLLLLAVALPARALVALKAQEAARRLAWMPPRTDRTRAAAARSSGDLPDVRVEEARAARARLKGGGGDPLGDGWTSRALGTSTSRVVLSAAPLPWGGSRLRTEATHAVDLPRGDAGLGSWARSRSGAREPPPVWSGW